MGFFNFLHKLTSSIKCDKKDILKRTWIFYGNKMQKVKINQSIFVDEGQLCLINCKSKFTDILEPGKYKINAHELPKTFDKLKLEKDRKNKKVKSVKFDIYYVNNDIINYVFGYSKKYKVNKTKYNESIDCCVEFKISNLTTHLQYLFLSRSYIPTKLYYELVFSKIDEIVLKSINEYKGELVDLQDEIIASGIKHNLQKEVAEIGFEIAHFSMKNYELTSNRKPSKKVKHNNDFSQEIDPKIEEEEPLEVYKNLLSESSNQEKPKETKSVFQNVIENGVIYYNPDDEK